MGNPWGVRGKTEGEFAFCETFFHYTGPLAVCQAGPFFWWGVERNFISFIIEREYSLNYSSLSAFEIGILIKIPFISYQFMRSL
jgi:hypothetical protein